MASIKLKELTEAKSASTDDIFIIEDANETKRITFDTIKKSMDIIESLTNLEIEAICQ